MNMFVTSEDRRQMAEALDRFTLANILHDSAQINKDEEVSRIANDLSNIPQGWWIQPRPFPANSWRMLYEMVNFVIKAYRTHKLALDQKFWRLIKNPAANLGIKGYEASILAENQAAHHISHYGGSDRTQFLDKAYEEGRVKVSWLKKLSCTNKRYHGVL